MDIGPPTIEEMLADGHIWRKNHLRMGLWRARVLNVSDPEQRGRIQVRILQLHPASSGVNTGPGFDASAPAVGTVPTPMPEGVPDQECPWAEPGVPFGGSPDEGFLMLPTVGSTVWVGFDQGFTGGPVWLGAWFGQGELPVEFTDPANIRLIKTPLGHILLFDDTARKVLLASAEGGPSSRVRLLEIDDQNQTVRLVNGSLPTASRITLTPTQVTIQQGADTQIIGVSNQWTIQRGSTTIVIDGSGNITVTNSGNTTVNTTGNVLLGTGAALGVVLDSIIAKYNAHTHVAPGGGGVTTVPTPLFVAGTDSSATVKAKT